MAKKKKAATKPPKRSPPGRAALQAIIDEYTEFLSKQDMHPDEWAQNPAHFAEEAMRCLDAGDADGAICWAMLAAALSNGLDFVRPGIEAVNQWAAREAVNRPHLLQRAKQNAALVSWRGKAEQAKREAAARYYAELEAAPRIRRARRCKEGGRWHDHQAADSPRLHCPRGKV